MNGFVASNGIRVYLDDNGDMDIDNSGRVALCGGPVLEAIREFFRAEEDERLGRIRLEGFPGLYAYRYNSDWINVVEEHDGAATEHRRQDVDAVRHRDFVSESERFARAYFDAHPEPEPWHSARAGEIWDVDLGEGGTRSVTLDLPDGVVFRDPYGPREISATSPDILDARRVYPGVAS